MSVNLFAKSLDQLYVQTKSGYKSVSEIRDTKTYYKERLDWREDRLERGIFADSLGEKKCKLPGGSNSITGIAIDDNGILWVLTSMDRTANGKNLPGQLSYYNPKKDKFIGCGRPNNEPWLGSLFIDKEGNKWVSGNYVGIMVACFTKNGQWFYWPSGGLGFEDKVLQYNKNKELEKAVFLSDFSAVEIDFKKKSVSKEANWHEERFAYEGHGGGDEKMFFNASEIINYSFNTGVMRYKNEGGFEIEVTLK